MLFRYTVFREQELMWQDPVDYSYLTYHNLQYEYHPSLLEQILRNMVFREQEMIWQDPVDYSYLNYEYDPSLLEQIL
jgi:hypothetical protein